jgi:DNA invertase Pin-like site-specific DNA recombinase
MADHRALSGFTDQELRDELARRVAERKAQRAETKRLRSLRPNGGQVTAQRAEARRKEMLALREQCLSWAEIAARFDIKPATVRTLVLAQRYRDRQRSPA